MTARQDLRADLAASTLHGSLLDPALESMNFLNEIAGKYPDAISFASGRPCEQFLTSSSSTATSTRSATT